MSFNIQMCYMSHGTMKAHVCYFVLMVWLLHYMYSLHAYFYTLENIINIETAELSKIVGPIGPSDKN